VYQQYLAPGNWSIRKSVLLPRCPLSTQGTYFEAPVSARVIHSKSAFLFLHREGTAARVQVEIEIQTSRCLLRRQNPSLHRLMAVGVVNTWCTFQRCLLLYRQGISSPSSPVSSISHHRLPIRAQSALAAQSRRSPRLRGRPFGYGVPVLAFSNAVLAI
jgi:hypothetical protein